MIFTQLEFIFFFITLLILLYFVKNNITKKILLLIYNCYFYAYFDYRFLLLLIFAAVSTFTFGNVLNILKKNRRIALSTGVAINLSILFFFKYYGFFIGSINNTFQINSISFNTLHKIVPLGVSFYIFRFVSYLCDSYKQKDPLITSSLLDFLIYGTFFPIIASGPISRARHFLPQLNSISLTLYNLYKGYRLFVIGFFLKTFVADRIAPYVNYFYENYEVFNSFTAWIATTAYSIQIYCDFAGYSSMAIGLSLMLGFNIEINFNFPYISKSISSFWGRWHITLSEWIRDYLYIPLGGNRKGKIKKYLNLLIAMTLCGLWHGASLTFIIWGFLHGLLLTVNHLWKDISNKTTLNRFPRIYSFISWFLSFFSISMCWIIFRSESIAQSTRIIQKMFSFSAVGVAWYQPFVIFIILSTILFHILYLYKNKLITLPIQNKLTPTILFCMLWLSIVFYPLEFQPFMYGQF